MAPPRGRDAVRTRADLLTAARTLFARDGYDRVTLRAVGEAVGVDPALVVRYFGGKAALFAEAARLDIDLPDLRGLDPEAIADALVDRFVALFDASENLLALLRTAATSAEAAAALREVLLEQAGPALATVAPDHPQERAALVGSQVVGLAFARHVLVVPAIAAMDRDALRAWLGPTLVGYLTGPAPV
ncbi:TetR/AcrR family transcriptional regulator [Actinomycetospora termitidis]|uniref:TetR family transcriptional regulator n=1 Tax=Actinomycetospora termitidis TaxID=3053470 RepID=A0ABT7M3F3_9PSEU|nr:TetR/AcrR family transcriptional regulator [Actinomycetospora sp. Odt1-22]MDL5155179.1 TetR family transcriptional regulator [Actinomycetospora sp. Odt1-22]